MPARAGIVSPGVLPAKPWQALQTIDFCAPGESSGPASARGYADKNSRTEQ